MAEYFKIGKFVAAFGVHGQLILLHSLGKKTSLKGINNLFLEEKKDSFIPWFIESANARSEDEVLLKLEGINSREEAQRLTQKTVWLSTADFRKLASRSTPAGLLGYIIVEDGKPLSPIEEVIEQPHQLLCRIEITGKEVLIPLNESTLLGIDHKKKQVRVTLPDGLLEIYL